MARQEIYERDHDLPGAAHRVELVGSPGQLNWPSICPNCGMPADQRVTIRKVFRHSAPTDDGFKKMWAYRIQSVDIPVCRRCADAHRTAAPELAPLQVLLSCTRTGVMFAVVPALAATAFAAFLTLGRIGQSGFSTYALVTLVLAAATAASGFAAWWQTRFRRVPPLTDVARACNFSDNLGDLLSGERHVYAIRNQQFADAFARANADRVFDARRRAKALRAHRMKHAFGWVALLVCGLLTLWFWISGEG